MDPTERLQLQKMLSASEADDNTPEIRKYKHSALISTDVQKMEFLKKKYSRLRKTNPQQFDAMCTSQCSFLFNVYTDLFNKIKKDELDLQILSRFLQVLKQIEDGKCGQHEGSVMIGKLLKELYIDSALKTAEHLEKRDKSSTTRVGPPVKKINWRQFKNMNSSENNTNN